MSKSILVDGIERLQIEIQELIDKMNNIQDDDMYGSKRTYIGYKIELLKRDILIEQLMLPARQKLMLEPMKPLIINKNLIGGIYISKEKVTELLEDCMKLRIIGKNTNPLVKLIGERLWLTFGGNDNDN